MLQIDPEKRALIDNSYYMWITTVRADGLPQPTPVWFIWYEESILIYTMRNAQKLKNIEAHPKVALSVCSDFEGEDFVVIFGEAWVDRAPTPFTEIAAYMDKYRDGITRLGTNPQDMAADYPVAIRVSVERIR